MSVSTSEIQSWVRPPESLESLGRCLFQSLDRETTEAFVCFLEWERGVFTFPAVAYEEEKKLLKILVDCDWREDPKGAFVRVFNHLGWGDHASAERIRSGLITKDKRSAPLGAYAYLPKSNLETASRLPENRVINPLLTEIVRCHLAIRKYSHSLEEGDYLFSAINQVGCMLLNRSKRKQALAALLDLAVHLSKAEVGLLLVHDGEQLRPEIELGLSPTIVTEMRFLPERDSVLDRVKACRRAVVIDDVSGPTIAIPAEYKVQIRGFIAIPFYIENRLVGMMCLATGDDAQDISTNLLETLETISAVMAIAVENDTLQRQLDGKLKLGESKDTEPASSTSLDAESWAELHHLRAAFRVADEGILISNSEGVVVYANPIAQEWVGIEAERPSGIQATPNSESRVLRWLKEQWRGGPNQRFMEVPFQKNSRVPMMATILRLPRSASYAEPGWVTFLRKQSIRIESSGNDQTVGLLRDETSKVQLASDLLNGFHDAAVDSQTDDVRAARAVLKRSCHSVQRLCEDLEDAESTRSNWVRRACDVSKVLRKAIDRVRPEWDELPWERADFQSERPMVVLGHPWQLRTAFVRVLLEILRRADEPRVPRIQLALDGQRATITFEFSWGSVDKKQAIGCFTMPTNVDEQRHSKRTLPSLGIQCALRILVRHGGRLTATTVAPDTLHVTVSLPLAPDADSGEKPSASSAKGEENAVHG